LKFRVIEIAGIGQVVLEKSGRAKRLSLSIRPFKGIRVAVPLTISFKKATLFAESKYNWLKKHCDHMEEKERKAMRLYRDMPIKRGPARRLIVTRLAQLSTHTGLVYNRVFVRRQKTRWGSCSHVNNISLNINLVRLPEILMDYVILHELMHTRIKNHGPLFWVGLAGLIENPRELDGILGQYGALLVVGG
jgi:predicted metal-dependent hydrolase